MPSLVGDSGRVLGVLGWASTRIRNLSLVLHCYRCQQWLCMDQSHELYTDIKGRGEARTYMLSIVNEPLP